MGSGGSTIARLKLKGIDGMTPPGVEYAAQFDPTRGMLPGPDVERMDRLKLFLDIADGGAWPLLVGGVTCLVDSDNERELCPLIAPSLDSVGLSGTTITVSFGVRCDL